MLVVCSVCLVQAPPAPTPSAVSGRLPTCSWLLQRVFLDILELLALSWLEQVVVPLARDGPVSSVRRLARAEVGSVSFEHDSDVFLSCRVESPSSRVARVKSALYNLCLVHSSSIPALNSHAPMSHARCVVNSVGDTEEGGRLSCGPGGTKSPSMSAQCGVRRPAVDELANLQQAPFKVA